MSAASHLTQADAVPQISKPRYDKRALRKAPPPPLPPMAVDEEELVDEIG